MRLVLWSVIPLWFTTAAAGLSGLAAREATRGDANIREVPGHDEYLLRWAELLRGSLKSAGESTLKLVPVGCGIPQPLFMLDPGHSHGKLTDCFTYHLSKATKINTINVMHHVYKASQATGGRCQVLDMGANDGYYALLAGAYGCSVRSVEPQSLCNEHLSLALGFNTIPGEVNLLRGAVGTTGSTLDIPRMDQCHGMFQATHKYSGPMESNTEGAGKHDGDYDTVKMFTAAALVDPGTRVTLWHVDVQGAEVDVLSSGREMLLAGRVDHLILELVGSRWAGLGVPMEDGHKALAELLGRYHCRDLATNEYMGAGAQFVEQFAKSGSDGEYWCFLDEAFRDAAVQALFPCLPHGSYSPAKKKLVEIMRNTRSRRIKKSKLGKH